jgi:hypothetical protein
MEKKPFIGISILTIVLLLAGASIPVGATTQPVVSNPAASAQAYIVYIGAGFFRINGEGNFGMGWHTTVENTGDTNITGFMYNEETTLSGKIVDYGNGSFSLWPGMSVGTSSAILLDFHPITRITLTVIVENTTYSKSGYSIGPFVLLTG